MGGIREKGPAMSKKVKAAPCPDVKILSPSELSCDPTYRALVRADLAGEPSARGILDDYREERGYSRCRKGLAREVILRNPRGAILGTLDAQERYERQERWLGANQSKAVEAAKVYHSLVKKLYQSALGSIQYGLGGQVGEDWGVYSKKWHGRYGPARWRNAGVRIEGYARDANLILYNYRGTEVARLPFPAPGVSLVTWVQEVTA